MTEQNGNQETPGLGAVGLFIFDLLKVFVIAIAVIVPVRWFLFQPFVVTGDSMRPNFEDGDYLVIDEISYRFREPERGEVVVLRFPQDPSQFFIKRVIGLPQERVVVQNGRVFIFNQDNPDGMILREDYLLGSNITFGEVDLKLGTDQYYLFGDNRFSSSDSRVWGALHRQNIVGRVVLRAFPITKFDFFTKPIYLLIMIRE